MSDGTTNAPVDPVAEARRIMAAQESGPAGDVASLKKQVKALWAAVIVTLVLVIVVGAFSVLPRMFGFGRGNFGGANFTPGQFRQQGGTGGPGVGPGPSTGQ